MFPTKRPQEISIHGFHISTLKLPILKADPIEEMTKKLGITPPEMIFGDNYVMIEHKPSGWGINFNAFDALDKVDKTGQSMLQVAYSKEWQKSRYVPSPTSWAEQSLLLSSLWSRNLTFQ